MRQAELRLAAGQVRQAFKRFVHAAETDSSLAVARRGALRLHSATPQTFAPARTGSPEPGSSGPQVASTSGQPGLGPEAVTELCAGVPLTTVASRWPGISGPENSSWNAAR